MGAKEDVVGEEDGESPFELSKIGGSVGGAEPGDVLECPPESFEACRGVDVLLGREARLDSKRRTSASFPRAWYRRASTVARGGAGGPLDRHTIPLMETLGPTLTLVNDDGVFKLQEPVPLALKARRILHVRIVDEDEAPKSRTTLGEDLLAIRARIVASGIPLLTKEEILEELRLHRGGYSEDDSRE